ncbi:MAG: fasciclin domain-containing protein [Bacteroidota bacterium]|nr:fasciclin domain-containing protein [Bacteroidota bacterium]
MNLKHLISRTGLFLLLSTPVLLTSCDKDEDDVPATPTITETVVASANFSLLKTAVVRAGLADYLNNTPNLTVFAPTNDAFLAAGLTEAVINATPIATLDAILKYHVLTTKIPSGSVPAGPNAEITTVGGVKAFVTKNAAGVFINGTPVVTADINASNGIIHAISAVLFPPAGNIVVTAQANPNFTYLVAAVLRADASGTSISGALSAAGPLTVFAPTNQAFIDAGFPTIASINAANANTLKNILLYHVIGARVFSSDLVNNSTPATAGGGTVLITLTGGAKVKGNGNATASTITGVNIVTTNGVIHVIDRVLLP